MADEDWEACCDPQAMLEFLVGAGTASDRKLRLFAAACCRRVWGRLADPASRHAVEVAERYAGGLAEMAELERAHEEANAFPRLLAATDNAAAAAWCTCAPLGERYPADEMASAVSSYAAAESGDLATEDEVQCELLRCLFGNPFRPRVGPGLLPPAVRSLAEAAYEERRPPAGLIDPARLAVLADALEEVGADATLLAHLRSPAPHARGCWALDAVLGLS